MLSVFGCNMSLIRKKELLPLVLQIIQIYTAD